MPLQDKDELEDSPILPKEPESISASFTQLQTLELYQEGLKPAEIAERRGYRLSTIISHLAELLETGYPIDLDKLVQVERQQKFWKPFKQWEMIPSQAFVSILAKSTATMRSS